MIETNTNRNQIVSYAESLLLVFYFHFQSPEILTVETLPGHSKMTDHYESPIR